MSTQIVAEWAIFFIASAGTAGRCRAVTINLFYPAVVDTNPEFDTPAVALVTFHFDDLFLDEAYMLKKPFPHGRRTHANTRMVHRREFHTPPCQLRAISLMPVCRMHYYGSDLHATAEPSATIDG